MSSETASRSAFMRYSESLVGSDGPPKKLQNLLDLVLNPRFPVARSLWIPPVDPFHVNRRL